MYSWLIHYSSLCLQNKLPRGIGPANTEWIVLGWRDRRNQPFQIYKDCGPYSRNNQFHCPVYQDLNNKVVSCIYIKQ